jgi:hypothetical protein
MDGRIEGSAQVVELIFLKLMPGALSFSAYYRGAYLIWRDKMRLPMLSVIASFNQHLYVYEPGKF